MVSWIHDGFLGSQWVLGFTMGFHDKVRVKKSRLFRTLRESSQVFDPFMHLGENKSGSENSSCGGADGTSGGAS